MDGSETDHCAVASQRAYTPEGRGAYACRIDAIEEIKGSPPEQARMLCVSQPIICGITSRLLWLKGRIYSEYIFLHKG